jgi:hypothetical protein
LETNADHAAKLLRNAAAFFRQVGEQTPALSGQMEVSARNYEHAAERVESDAAGECEPPDDGKSGA